MSKVQDVARALRSLVAALPPSRRRQFWSLCLLMVCAAVAEMASLGALIPFLALLAGPQDSGPAGSVARWVQSALGVPAASAILPITVAFASVAIVAAGVRIALNIALARTNFRIGHEIGSLIYARALNQPYAYHVRHNSAEVVGGVVKVDVAVYVLLAVLVGVSSSLLALCIITTMLVVNAFVAITAAVGFGGTYVLASRLVHHRLLENGRVINATTPQRLQVMNESLGGIRDVILDHTQDYHQRRFDAIDGALRRAQESNQILIPTPRFLIEGIGMVVIAVIGCWFALRGGGIATALPTLGVLVLGGQRLLPLMQQAYQGWTMISGHLAVVEDVTRLIESPDESHSRPDAQVLRLAVNQEIRFENVAFRFLGAEKDVLRGTSFSIPAGARVGIVGPTGSGKSTLLNLLMGLLEPSEGIILIDGKPLDETSLRGWQESIAHVPQSIYLADATIEENVAVGTPREQIDVARVDNALARAQLTAVVAALPEGRYSLVGENGVRLSGGQRQRLGIARALYKQASVLVLDEATSALDEQTELEVMGSVEALARDITLIMIAHRVSTLRSCDFLLRVEGGRVARCEQSASIPTQDTN